MYKYLIKYFSLCYILLNCNNIYSQKFFPFLLTDTGQSKDFIEKGKEDSDIIINPMSFTDNGDGTITDNITGLIWQKYDGNECTFELAQKYCDTLNLGNYDDWRLPNSMELFSINNFDKVNPALNTTFFTKTNAEYWWSQDHQIGDSNKIWVVNSGGGIGNHSKFETVSAGGTKKFHVRAVRNSIFKEFTSNQKYSSNNQIVKDNNTGLTWQKNILHQTMTWEDALIYADSIVLQGYEDWRLPNVKELQSLVNIKVSKPAIDMTIFTNMVSGRFWSSTSMTNSSNKAWDLNNDFGIISYNDKSNKQYVILVRGGNDNSNLMIEEVKINGGEFIMGNHDTNNSLNIDADELPLHKVKINDFVVSVNEITNQQYIEFLNEYFKNNRIIVQNGIVYLKENNVILNYTSNYNQSYVINFNTSYFNIKTMVNYHPVVGITWYGAATFCNWLSYKNQLDSCYNLNTFSCDFSKDGYRLPTEAEWEYAARGNKYFPYLNHANSDILDLNSVNINNSNDPYERNDNDSNLLTTPIYFYNGNLNEKNEYNWNSGFLNYQTKSNMNAYGIYDIQGNVWEYVNDWYHKEYYSNSEYDNPKGPDEEYKFEDNKAYKVIRGGGWKSDFNSIRISDRNTNFKLNNESKNDFDIGFRVCRNNKINTSIKDLNLFEMGTNLKIYPNPNIYDKSFTVVYNLDMDSDVKLKISDILGKEIKTEINQFQKKGYYKQQINNLILENGSYYFYLIINEKVYSTFVIINNR